MGGLLVLEAESGCHSLQPACCWLWGTHGVVWWSGARWCVLAGPPRPRPWSGRSGLAAAEMARMAGLLLAAERLWCSWSAGLQMQQCLHSQRCCSLEILPEHVLALLGASCLLGMLIRALPGHLVYSCSSSSSRCWWGARILHPTARCRQHQVLQHTPCPGSLVHLTPWTEPSRLSQHQALHQGLCPGSLVHLTPWRPSLAADCVAGVQSTYSLAYGMTGSYVTASAVCQTSVLSTSAAATAAAAASPVRARTAQPWLMTHAGPSLTPEPSTLDTEP